VSWHPAVNDRKCGAILAHEFERWSWAISRYSNSSRRSLRLYSSISRSSRSRRNNRNMG
jgi:hypothetical protein